MKKLTAFAVCENQMAPSVGTAEVFLLWDGREPVIVKRSDNIPRLLAEHNVETLICGGIGNCLAEVLSQQSIRVIPGIAGNWQTAAAALAQGRLVPGCSYTCTEHGRICGDCPGNF